MEYAFENEEYIDIDYCVRNIQGKCVEFLKKYSGPEAIKEYLDRKVCRQENARWYAAQLLFEKVNGLVQRYSLKKTNMLFYGPSGSGKTYIFELLAEISPVPKAIVDASKITEEGFKGNDVADVLCPLKYRYPGIEHGIVALDEFDKVIIPSYSSNGSNVHEAVQAALLKVFEGCLVSKETRGSIDTTDISFVCLGAFSALTDSSINRKPIGFLRDIQDAMLTRQEKITDNLIRHGMIREMAGRLHTVVELEPLTLEDYRSILAHIEDSALDEIKKSFRLQYHIYIELTGDGAEELAKTAYEQKLGARGLNGVLERVCRMKLAEVRQNKEKIMLIDAVSIRKAETMGRCNPVWYYEKYV